MGEGKRRYRSAPWEEGAGGGTQGAFPHPSWDSSEGEEEAVHISAGVTNVKETHFSFAKGTLTYMALGILEGWLAKE